MNFVELSENNRNLTDFSILFKDNFDYDCATFVRAPGRVNIIGEHIDYCGYSVLPMATDQDIVMGFFTVSGGRTLKLINKNQLYEPFEVEVDDIVINDSVPKWYDYFLCGYRGIVDYAKEKKLVTDKCSLYVLVDGIIPPNAGLSSSSALVVCAAIVTMKAFNLNISKKELAKLCANCEKYIGTQGGGMDQTISLMAIKGSAMCIDFSLKEFEVESIILPDNAIFVVTHTQEQMNKAATNQFNQRVVESKLCAKVLITLLQPDSDHRQYNRLVDIQKKLNLDFTQMLLKIDENLKMIYSKDELINLLNVNVEIFNKEILSKNTQEMIEFYLYNRAKHVVSEAQRVVQFTRLCSKSRGDMNILYELGLLMNESQLSCKDLYECSSETLDKLVDVCKRAGSFGSRLTGAGWGGCVISLLSKETVEGFMQYVAQNFYNDTPENIKELMFISKPSSGASFIN